VNKVKIPMVMAAESAIESMNGVESKIHLIRGQRVMLDADLADIYGVELKRLNEQVSRNAKRFPQDFAFQLKRQELTILKSQIATSSSHGGRRKLPWVFTEHGAIMLASVLNSERAVEMSVFIVRAFAQMREMLLSNRGLAAKLDELENRISDHDGTITDLVTAIRQLLDQPDAPPREIGFHVRERAVRYRIKR